MRVFVVENVADVDFSFVEENRVNDGRELFVVADNDNFFGAVDGQKQFARRGFTGFVGDNQIERKLVKPEMFRRQSNARRADNRKILQQVFADKIFVLGIGKHGAPDIAVVL